MAAEGSRTQQDSAGQVPRSGCSPSASLHRWAWFRWLDVHFNSVIVVLIATVTVFSGVIAFLENRASNHYAELVRSGQTLAMDALGYDMSSRQQENYDFYLYTTWNEWQRRGSQAQKDGNEIVATRSDEIASSISPLTPLLDRDKGYFHPETETENQYVDFYGYHVDTNLITTTMLLEQRAFTIETANIWNSRADGYVTILTVLAVSLFLYGLSTTIKGGLRYLFAIVGTFLVGLAGLSTANLTLRPVPAIPSEAIEQYGRGMGQSYLGNYAEAIEAFDAAITAYPDYGNAFYGRAEARFVLRDYRAAEQDYLRAMESGHDDRSTRWNLGWIYYLLGDYQRSLEVSRQALELDPNLSPVAMNVAFALLADGDTEAAMDQFESALSMAADPNSAVPPSWNHLYLRETLNDLDRLIAALEGQADFYQEPDLSQVADREGLRLAAEAARLRVEEGMVSIEVAGAPRLEPIEASLSPITFAREVGPDGELLGQGQIFPNGEPSIVASLPYDDLAAGAVVSRRVMLYGSDEPGTVEYLPTMGEDLVHEGERAGTFQHAMKAPWPGDLGLSPGRYVVEYYVNGYLMQAGSFVVAAQDTPTLGPVVFATERASGGIVLGAADLFPAGVAQVYGIFNFSGVPQDSEVTARWYRDGVLYSQETDLTGGWGHWYFSLSDVARGDYRLDLHLEGQEEPLQSATFRVVDVDNYLQAVGAEPDDAVFHLELGNAFAAAGRYEEASARYQRATDLDPECAGCYHRWWSALKEEGDYDAALEKLEKAIELRPREYPYLCDLGETYYLSGDEEQAADAYRQAAPASPAYVYNRWGDAFYNQERYDEARTRYQQAIELAPTESLYHSNLGWADLKLEEYDQAVDAFQRAVTLSPNSQVDQANLGEAYYQMGEYDLALAAFERAVMLAPGYARAHNQWGDVLYDQAQYREAAQKYQEAIELLPDTALYHSNLGWAYYQMEEYDLASAALQHAVELDPDRDSDYNHWGNALYALGRYADSAEKYRQAIELNPDDAVYHSNLGDACYELGEYEQAVTAYEQAVTLDPEDASSYNRWGNALFALGQYAESAEKYRQAIELNPDDAVYHSNLGGAYYELGEYEAAVTAYEQAVALDPEDASSYNRWGNALFALDRYAESTEKYRQAIGLNPDDAVFHSNLGDAYYELGEYEQAAIAYEQAVALDPGYATAYNMWGNALYNLGKYAEAAASHRQAIDSSPDTAVYHYNLGWDYYKLQETEMAIAEFEEAAELAAQQGDEALQQDAEAMLQELR
jgi:tetratricopeptide (TPR) repeat protein